MSIFPLLFLPAGQPEFYVTHELFLSDDDAIFLVVVNLSKPREERMKDLHYWLQFIAGRRGGGGEGTKPRAVVVCTHPDAAVEDQCKKCGDEYSSQWASQNQGQIQARYAEVLDVQLPWLVLDVRNHSSALRKFLRTLHASIISQLAPAPKSCVAAMEHLERLRHNAAFQLAPLASVDEFLDSIHFVKSDVESRKESLRAALLRCDTGEEEEGESCSYF